MKRHSTLFFLFFSLLVYIPNLSAQLFIDTTYTAEQMVMDFFDGDCVEVSNVTFTGADLAMAYFEGANTSLGIPAGIFLSSGNVYDAIGPNDAENTSTIHMTAGDEDLENLLGGMLTYDAAVLEFDITPTSDSLDFSYVFGSEEYLEYVGSAFNDIFAFFISGPGIVGYQNIAVIPDNPLKPVSINNINADSFPQYFVNNGNNELSDFEYDGFTTKLPAPFLASPGAIYHIKLALTDVGDGFFDSGVFIGIESLCGESELTPPAIIEVEQDGSTIDLQNLSRYATSYVWDFGDNTTSTERYPPPHTYSEEGNYEIVLITENYCCKDTTSVTVTIDNTTATDELIQKPFMISPNPVTGQFVVQWQIALDARIELYNLTGQLLETVTTNGDAIFDLSQYASGLYNVVIKTEKGLFTERVIKN